MLWVIYHLRRFLARIAICLCFGIVDFDMDGEVDILWQNTDGTLAIWFMNGTTVGAGGGGVGVVLSAWHIKP